jgi:hypothetical protein|tara:strand:- start:352 stop:576 length:225 start_codon:yes stop_codon:yes gene_type:complete
MASQLDSVILWSDAVEQFTEMILPMIEVQEQRLGHVDIPARSEAWSNYADSLHAEEVISDWQVENWEHPDCCND